MPHSVLTRGRKTVARLTALAMVASIMVVGALPASAAPVDTSATCPAGSIPSAGFVDIGAYAASSQLAINCLVYWDISKGTSATTYSPAMEVTRWQMALFLTRQAEVHGLTLGNGSDQGFTDIAAYPAATRTAINQLAQLGITEGTTPTTFSPGAAVPRWQMALFLTRLLDAAGYTLGDGSSQGFTDIGAYPASTQVAINQVAQAGVATGFTATTFGPGQNTTRVQMAIFLTRTLAAGGVVFPPSTNASFMVSPANTQVVQTATGGAAIQYSVSGLTAGAAYEIALFSCGDYGTDGYVRSDGERYPNRLGQSNEGMFTFRDQNWNDQADGNGSTYNGNALILSAFFAPVNLTQTTQTANAAGVIDFRVGVTSATVSDCAVPVIWRDAVGGTANVLDLDPDTTNSWNAPDESFAVGATAVFHRGEAPTGDDHNDYVVFLDTAANLIVADNGYAYYYGRTGDMYAYDNGAIDITVTEDRFEMYLSIGDGFAHDSGPVTGTYERSGGSVFASDEDSSGNVAVNVVATLDAATSNVKVTWAYPAQPGSNYRQFCVDRYTAALVFVDTQCTTSLQSINPNTAPTEVSFTAVPVGTFIFAVYGVSGSNQDNDYALISNAVTVAAPAIPAALITDQRVSTDGATVGILDFGAVPDEVRIRFDRQMDDTDVSNALFFRWSDSDSVYQVACGDQALCTWHDVGANLDRELRMVLTAEPVFISGTANGLDITGSGATMTLVSGGVQTAAGGSVNLADSPDKMLDIAAALP